MKKEKMEKENRNVIRNSSEIEESNFDLVDNPDEFELSSDDDSDDYDSEFEFEVKFDSDSYKGCLLGGIVIFLSFIVCSIILYAMVYIGEKIISFIIY